MEGTQHQSVLPGSHFPLCSLRDPRSRSVRWRGPSPTPNPPAPRAPTARSWPRESPGSPSRRWGGGTGRAQGLPGALARSPGSRLQPGALRGPWEPPGRPGRRGLTTCSAGGGGGGGGGGGSGGGGTAPAGCRPPALLRVVPPSPAPLRSAQLRLSADSLRSGSPAPPAPAEPAPCGSPPPALSPPAALPAPRTLQPPEGCAERRPGAARLTAEGEGSTCPIFRRP